MGAEITEGAEMVANGWEGTSPGVGAGACRSGEWAGAVITGVSSAKLAANIALVIALLCSYRVKIIKLDLACSVARQAALSLHSAWVSFMLVRAVWT